MSCNRSGKHVSLMTRKRCEGLVKLAIPILQTLLAVDDTSLAMIYIYIFTKNLIEKIVFLATPVFLVVHFMILLAFCK